MAPFKRGRQPKMTTQALLSMDMDESSSDSDFRIDDHISDDDDDDQSNSGDEEATSSSDDDSDDDNDDAGSGDNSTQELRDLLEDDGDQQSCVNGKLNSMLTQIANSKKENVPNVPTKPICCVCLGDRSDDSNEIIECDGCGVSVHEGCYGVSDNASISSTNSTCSTEPWFCEACRADVTEPVCELCPNKGGIYKETDVGKWVHLVCALYVPGVAFGEVDQLSSVTLFEMQYSKWGAKVCSLCENTRFARTGVCIGCDAGMCKTYFHVTCAQAAGFLTEAHHEEADAADPFYAHCKVHSEKEMVKKRKRNFHTFHLNMQQKQREKHALKLEDDPCPAQQRTQRKLSKYRQKYNAHKQLKADPWVPTQKMSRLLTTSASACKRLLAKAEIKSVDVELLERQGAQISSLTDIRKKWHIAPAFSVEFIAYYLDRISRSRELKQNLGEMMRNNVSLTTEQDMLRKDYDEKLDKNNELKARQDVLVGIVNQMHRTLTTLCPSKNLPNASNIGQAIQPEQIKPPSTPPSRPISVPTPAALKMGVGFPLAHLGPPGSKVDSTRLLSTHAKNTASTAAPQLTVAVPVISSAPSTPTIGVHNFDCGICKRFNDQHLLAKCDTCNLHYHLGCLNPPLTRHPKKSKLYGWQCSECDNTDESDPVTDMPKGPRKVRTRFKKDGPFIWDQKLLEKSEDLQEPEVLPELQSTKRRSTDCLPVKAPQAGIKKTLNKSLPSINSSDGLPQETLLKKTKLSQGDTDIDAKPLSSPHQLLSPNTMRKGLLPPIQADLSLEKPLHLILSPKTLIPSNEPDPLGLPDASDIRSVPTDLNNSEANKLARKQKRKEKHKNKHNLSSDIEKSPNKEHKRKRKKKDHDHDMENPNDSSAVVPKIKIKFKTLPLPGEVTPEAHFFYVPADTVRSEEGSRPTSVETVEDTLTMPNIQPSPAMNASTAAAVVMMTPAPFKEMKRNSAGSPSKTPMHARKISPRKSNQRTSLSSEGGTLKIRTKTPITMLCCACNEPGGTASIVTCDECRKHFHFTTCLEPPLKKTPKIRGYSWHCAECDPTDEDIK